MCCHLLDSLFSVLVVYVILMYFIINSTTDQSNACMESIFLSVGCSVTCINGTELDSRET